MKIKNDIRKYRKRVDVSMKELAERLDVNYTHLSSLERNKQHLIKNLDVDKLVEILGVSSKEIFEVVT